MNQYFEGILQLREPTKEIIRFVKDKIEENPRIFISKEVRLKNGIDLYISSQRFLLSLGNMLKKKFTGELKTSRKLHTEKRQTSKKLYRVNVLFRPLPYKLGDIIVYRGEKIKITKLGPKLSGKSLETGKKIMVDYKDLYV